MKRSGILFFALLIVVACTTEKETPKGYKFTVVKKGDGNIAQPGTFLKVEVMFKDSKDSVYYDNRDEEFAQIIQVYGKENMEYEEGISEVFRMLSKGDSVVMKVPAQVFFEKTSGQPVPPGVDPKSDLTFCLRVKDVMDTAAVEKLQADMIAKRNEESMRAKTTQLGIDTVLIDNYLREKNITALTTPSGLRYVIKKKGNGPLAQAGQTVSVNYTGYLLDGTFFDSSVEADAKANNKLTPGRAYGPYELQAATGSVIQGWDEMLLLMNKGEKVTVYIPSTLAYGNNRRSEEIIENSILVFDMELVNVK